MRQLFKLWQTWLSIALFLLALFLGVGLPMIIPSTPYNGAVIIIVGLAVSVPLFIWAYKLYRRQKSTSQPSKVVKLNLTDTLTAMHRCLVKLQKEKASHTKLSYTQWSKVMPTLADRMGIVKLKDWGKFERNAASRIRRAIPRKNFKRQINPKHRFTEVLKWKDKAYRSALYAASELKDEMLKSGEWTFNDGIKASEWLDGYGWGVKKLRDDDPQWGELFESISNYLKKDDALRNLIKKHIDFSLMCNNIRLLTYYASKFKDDVFSVMLCEGLLGSPISPEEVEIALSEILSDIDKRLGEIKK
jgi:hypothetical protein